MGKEIDPKILQMVMQTMGGGQQVSPQMLQGVMATLAAMKASEMVPKAKKPNAIHGEGEQGPKNPQQYAQHALNRMVPGNGPLRSNITPEQIEQLASLLKDPKILQQLLAQPPVQGHAPAPSPGIPGAPGQPMEV